MRLWEITELLNSYKAVWLFIWPQNRRLDFYSHWTVDRNIEVWQPTLCWKLNILSLDVFCGGLRVINSQSQWDMFICGIKYWSGSHWVWTTPVLLLPTKSFGHYLKFYCKTKHCCRNTPTHTHSSFFLAEVALDSCFVWIKDTAQGVGFQQTNLWRIS